MKILIDPGHGGSDPGAVNSKLKIRESDITLAVSLRLRDELTLRGAVAKMTRDKDVFIGLEERCRMANHTRPDLFLSLHCNAAVNPNAQGVEVFTSPRKTVSDSFAATLIDAWAKAFPCQINRGIKEASFRVLTATLAPAVLLEMGFITNNGEALVMMSEEWKITAAEVIATAILRYGGDYNG